MKLSNFRIQLIFQEGDFLIGTAQDADLPKDVRQEAAWLVKHHPYSQNFHPSLPARLDRGDEEPERRDDQWLDAMPPVWMMLSRKCE